MTNDAESSKSWEGEVASATVELNINAAAAAVKIKIFFIGGSFENLILI